MKKYLSGINIYVCFIFLTVILILSGCGGNNDNNTGAGKEYTSGVSVKVLLSVDSSDPGNILQKFSTDLSDVDSVDITASWASGSAGPEACIQGADNYWDCNMTNLPADIPITLNLSAKDLTPTEVYTGTATVTLTYGVVSSVAVNMQSTNPDLVNLSVPVVLNAVFAGAEAVMGTPLSLDVTIADNSGDTVSVSYSSANGGAFSPPTDSAVIPAAGSIGLTTSYTAATQTANYTDTITIVLDDGTGFISSFAFNINVVVNESSNNGTANFPPAITGINVSVDAAGNATLTAVVSDESPSTLTYNWSIETNTYTTNPITILQPTAGTLINVVVTDEQSLAHNYSMTWGYKVISNSYKITQLTTDNFNNEGFLANEAGQVAWSASGGTDGGWDDEIFLYDGSSVIQLTTDNTIDWEPSLNNSGQVAWSGTGGTDGGTDHEIFLYDGSSVIQLTTNNTEDYYQGYVPSLNDAGQVAWVGIGGTDGGTDTEIFLYDGSSVTQLTTNNARDWYPFLNNSGQVAWYGTGGTDGGTDREIFLYDGSSVIQLTTNNTVDWYLSLNNSGQVAWSGTGGTDGGADTEIFLYNGSSVTQLTTNSGEDSVTFLNDAGQVTWFSTGGTDGGTDREIFLYDGSSVIQLTTNNTEDFISDFNNSGQVVWVGSGGTDGGFDSELFLYDGSSVTQLTTNNTVDFYPSLNNSGQIAWLGTGGTDGGTDREIFLYDGSSVTQFTTNNTVEWKPSLNNSGQVVWLGTGGTDGGTDYEIFLYNL